MIPTRRLFAAAVFVLACAAQDPSSSAAPADKGTAAPAAPSRSLVFTLQAAYAQPPKDRNTFDVWVPLPWSDQDQKISSLVIQAPINGEISVEPEYGDSAFHFRSGPRGGAGFQITVRFRVDRKEVRRTELAQIPTAPVAPPPNLQRFLKSDRLVPIDAETKALAARITSGKSTVREKARAIYDHVVGNFRYDKSGQGWGQGDLRYALTVRKGTSTDLATAFTGLARASEIPARFVAGFKIPNGPKEGYLNECHAWAEFWIDGLGWIPVDPTAALTASAPAGAYFGWIDADRVQISVGRDVVLAPPQNGDPINFWLYPYAEGDGQPLTGAGYRFQWSEAPPPGPSPSAAPGKAPAPVDPNAARAPGR